MAVDAHVARLVYVGGYGTTEESSEEIFGLALVPRPSFGQPEFRTVFFGVRM